MEEQTGQSKIRQAIVEMADWLALVISFAYVRLRRMCVCVSQRQHAQLEGFCGAVSDAVLLLQEVAVCCLVSS